MGEHGAKQRYEMLDALRGVAALIVMLHHVLPAMTRVQLFRSGYLAVDFFFMLSGLVVANAWEARLAGGATVRAFAASRLRRVYPVMATGATAGALVALLGGASSVAVALLRHLTFWPTMDSGDGVFPLDGVEWSLLFELLANAVYATVLFQLSTRALTLVVVIAAVALVAVADPQLGLAVGDRPSNLLLGVPRVLASYTLGVLLYRLLRERRGPQVTVPSVASPVLLIALLIVPSLLRARVGPAVVDPLVALLGFPVIIVAACRADPSPCWSAVGQLGAAISFPLYAIHLPVLCLLIGPRVGLSGASGVAATVVLALALSLLMAGGALLRFRSRPLAPIPA